MSNELYADETVLADDYPVYGNFMYLADGKPYRSNWHDVSVGELKKREGFTEVRRCNWRRFDDTGKRFARPITSTHATILRRINDDNHRHPNHNEAERLFFG